MYFIGVTTASSSIHRIFPRWTELSGVAGAALIGVDIPVDAPPEACRAAVGRLRDDPSAEGALVTTHKVALWRHARDLFTGFDADAAALGEISCVVKRGDRLTGLGIDTLTAGLALREILPDAPFHGHALILGAGGAAVALAVHLYRDHQPAELTLTDISAARLEQIRRLTPARLRLISRPEDHDRLLATLPPASLVVNATGMGKDRPGSPLTAAARFPAEAVAWDFNYRGELVFLDYARAQGIRAVDGWSYFLHGWSQILSRVFGFDLTPDLFAAMREAALSR